MTSTPSPIFVPLKEAMQRLENDGFAYVPAPVMKDALLAAGLTDWDRFAASWDNLGTDLYMADGGRYRRRRFAAFAAHGSDIARKPHQPHYQSRDYNPLNGGVARWFEPIVEDIQTHPALLAIIRACSDMFTALTPEAERPKSWHVEIHQFRIEASAGKSGEPTPEGMHQDGVDWVLVLLVRRENVASGETRIADLRRNFIGAFVLAEPFDSALVNDARVYHGVTSIAPLDPARPTWRDVLVVTLRRE